MDAPVDTAWRPPSELDEYRIVRSLGFGAMGQVYLAHDLLLDRPVAIKFVDAAADPEAKARALEEARAIARLTHPNVVAIYRVVELAGHPCLVSEYVKGRPLSEAERPMAWRRVVDIACDLARGLAAAHRRGVLHRDVKPANAILADDGGAKLLDFGLARIIDAQDLPARSTEARAPEPHRIGAEAGALVTDQTAPLASRTVSSQVVDTPGLAAQMIGTPIYMAPEIWRGEPASRRSDLYSLGILLYELLAGVPPYHDLSLADLANAAQLRDIARLATVVPDIEPALAAIVDRLVERDPDARFASADALVVALEDCAAGPARTVHPDGNPYRGLAVFEPAHASLFFGRASELRELVDRVRLEPFIVVGGDSGTGKSSLCRAGVLPWLAEHGGWVCVELVPGRQPLQSLAVVLAPWSLLGEAELVAALRERPAATARAIRQQLVAPSNGGAPRRLVLFVDQLEELLTLAEPSEARSVAAAIAALAVRSPSVRVLATARSDFLSRLAALPDLGDEMARGLYFLRPLGAEHMRDVITRPAAAKGVVFESDALVDALIAQTEDAPGGLPLLQFTLAELWEARDVEAGVIRAASLAAVGGVAGALTRHADRVLAGLSEGERDAARRILLRLVTVQGTRARRPKSELVGDGAAHEAGRAALEALVRGRVLVANNAQDGAYELAHEALLASWPTLQTWRQQDAASQALRDRLEHAAAAWHRMGARDLLWRRRQLAEARALDRASLAAREAAFLAASRAALRQRRRLTVGAAAVLVTAAVAIGLTIRARARDELDRLIADQTRAAQAGQISARQVALARDAVQRRALGLFDAHHWTDGEEAWAEVEALAMREEQEYRSAAAHIDSILLLEPGRAGLRDWAADLAFERLVRAEHDHRRDLADELSSRLAAYNTGRYQGTLDATVHVVLAVEPAGTQVWIERAGAPRALVGQAPMPPATLPSGPAVLVFDAPGYVSARLPIALAPGDNPELKVALPPAASAPAGMIYVPAGRFLFGSDDRGDVRRGFLATVPLHELTIGSYYIGRYEVTFGEWIAYLDDLPAEERLRRAPHTVDEGKPLTLSEIAPRRWRLTMTPSAQMYSVEMGQRLHYEGRTQREDQDWMKFPVSAVSFDDAVAYTVWLDRTGRVPGARLCDEDEWERAARGADGRIYPGGATLAPDDANIDVTYGRDPRAFGPDEVGAHPASRSPVGADDMAGNAYEWARSIEVVGAPIIRGGCWHQGELAARTMNRAHAEPTFRNSVVGVRICATPR